MSDEILQKYTATKPSILYSLFDGLDEPLGALLGFAFLFQFNLPMVLSSLLAYTVGVMLYISLNELLLAAYKYGETHLIIIGVSLGMMVMAGISLNAK